MLTNLSQLETQLNITKKRKVAVVCADEDSIRAILHPKLEAYVVPVFFGDSIAIQSILNEQNHTNHVYEIVSCRDDVDAAQQAVISVKKGNSDVLMKGYLQTRDFLKAIVDQNQGIVRDRLLSHIALNEVPAYHKLFMTTDGGMVVSPDLGMKQKISRNALEVAHRIGIHIPKVAILSAAEHVNEKSKDSIEAQRVQEFLVKNYRNSCDVAGPISLDLALSHDIALKKGYTNPVAGDADILVGSSIDMMNVLGKSIIILGGGRMAGIIWGADVPIVMTSRGSSSDEKLYSIMLALATCEDAI